MAHHSSSHPVPSRPVDCSCGGKGARKRILVHPALKRDQLGLITTVTWLHHTVWRTIPSTQCVTAVSPYNTKSVSSNHLALDAVAPISGQGAVA